MRVGLCGLGEIGRHHLAAISGSTEAELVAVCDLDRDLAERSAEGAEAFTSVQEMLVDRRSSRLSTSAFPTFCIGK